VCVCVCVCVFVCVKSDALVCLRVCLRVRAKRAREFVSWATKGKRSVRRRATASRPLLPIHRRTLYNLYI
jgi:hypothetical protein